jgi:hypothetical protein
MGRRDSHQTSQEFREDNKNMFKRLDNGKYGGYKKGVQNGPEVRRAPRKAR